MTAREIALRAGLSPAHFVAPRRFRHNDPVTLTDVNGETHQGNLHLPPVATFGGPGGAHWEPQSTDGGLGVYVIRSNGYFFRTEGRLS